MIVNNTCPNVRIFPYKDTKGMIQSFFLFPGINGEVPDSIKDDAAFKEQKEAGLMVIIPTKKDSAPDASRLTITPDRVALVPDNDVVDALMDMDEKKAMSLLPDVVKKATLVVWKTREKRGNIVAAIEKQIENIDNLNMPTRK